MTEFWPPESGYIVESIFAGYIAVVNGLAQTTRGTLKTSYSVD